MYAPHFRFSVQNNTGASADVSLVLRSKKFDSNGALQYGAATTLMSAVTIGAGLDAQSTPVDNTAGLDLEGDLDCFADIAAGSPDGDVTVLLHRSINGTDWPDDDAGGLVTSINFTTPGTKRRVENVS